MVHGSPPFQREALSRACRGASQTCQAVAELFESDCRSGAKVDLSNGSLLSRRRAISPANASAGTSRADGVTLGPHASSYAKAGQGIERKCGVFKPAAIIDRSII